MKKLLSVPIAIGIGMMMVSVVAFAQNKTDDARMQRDIEVAENILSTLIKQELGKRNFFPLEVEGSYLPGYGVTFQLPNQFYGNLFFIDGDDDMSWNIQIPEPAQPVQPVVAGAPSQPTRVQSYSYSVSGSNNNSEQVQEVKRNSQRSKTRAAKVQRTSNADSAVFLYNQYLVEASKNFIADYSDLLSQLQPNERIVITNRINGNDFQTVWLAGGFRKQNVIRVEATKSDVNQFRQGKTTRDQLMNKIKTINSEASDEMQPDLELLSSIFNRLYDRDLSKTFFSDGNIYYERLNDFGAIYHMQVYASNLLGTSFDNVTYYDMPTLHITDVDQATRDKKVKEIYPEFEKNIKEDFLEYGRTVKSLKDNESLIFEIAMTRCNGCNIPSTLELSIKNSVLKDYASGKITKEAALAKINVKQGANQ